MRALEPMCGRPSRAGTWASEGRRARDPSRPGSDARASLEAAGDVDAYRASRAARAFDSDVVDIVTNRANATWARKLIELGR